MGAALGAVLGAHSGAVAAERIGEREYGPLAVRAESALRRGLDAAVRTQFHRRQAFRLGTGREVLSLAWWPAEGGAMHCVLALLQKEGVQVFDALAGEREAPPWACDGEPALRLSDFDADGCVDVLALFPLRPPSGERFMWPLVLQCGRDGGYAVDAVRTATLRDGATPSTLAEALVRLGQASLKPPAR